MIGRLSLKARLILGVIALAGIGLAAADVATYASLRSFLVQRTDQSLQDEHSAYEHDCHGGPGRAGPPGGGGNGFAVLRTSAGTFICSLPQTFSGATPSAPRWPSTSTVTGGESGVRYFTVSSRDGGSRYRVRAESQPGGGVLLTAASLSDVDATLRQLLTIELLVTASVLLALIALGVWVVRLGLRPLEAIGETASAIAGGDLSKRVARAEPRTEVGRLGLALNAMLEQIQSAFDATAASEQRLRRFVADASHELRTPLAAVRAYAELFARGAESRPDDLARSMSGIERESRRMSRLVDDLLLLARLDEGRPLEHRPVDLAELVGEAVDTAAAVDPDRPLMLTTEDAWVGGDRERLRQVVDNLLANVRAHTQPGAPAAVRVLRRDGSAVIEVEDRGAGLRPDEAARMFERFYRADKSRGRARGGTGLGLSIVAAVAEAHGGSATASSEPGLGTVVRVTLPLAGRQLRHVDRHRHDDEQVQQLGVQGGAPLGRPLRRWHPRAARQAAVAVVRAACRRLTATSQQAFTASLAAAGSLEVSTERTHPKGKDRTDDEHAQERTPGRLVDGVRRARRRGARRGGLEREHDDDHPGAEHAAARP